MLVSGAETVKSLALNLWTALGVFKLLLIRIVIGDGGCLEFLLKQM